MSLTRKLAQVVGSPSRPVPPQTWSDAVAQVSQEKRTPRAISDAWQAVPPDVARSPAFVQGLIDTRVLTSATASNVLRRLPDEVVGNRDVARTLVQWDVTTLEALPHFSTDAAFLREVLKPRLAAKLEETANTRRLPALLRRGVGRCESLLSLDTTGTLAHDPELLALAAMHPALLALFPEEATGKVAELEPFRRLGIVRVDRFAGHEALTEELLANRADVKNTRGDTRPLAVVVASRHDPTTLINLENVAKLAPSHRVLYFEASHDSQLTEALSEATADGQVPADVLLLMGHGMRRTLNLSSPTFDWSLKTRDQYFDITDIPHLQARGAGGWLADGAKVVLSSCSTGQGRETKSNLANAVARPWPQAHVFAPDSPTVPPTLGLDDDGRLESVFFGIPDVVDQTYEIPAARP